MSTVQPPERPDEQPGDGGSSPSDAQWEDFLRQAAEDGGRGAPKEPSARARVVARRLREQDARAASGGGRRRRWWGKRVAEPGPWTPPGWRTGPAWQEMNGRAARRRRTGSVVGVVLVVALAVVAVRPSLVLDRIPGAREDGATSGAPLPGETSLLPAETALPSAAPGAVQDSSLPTLAHPFRGSPALRWADGADAIELPEAEAVSGLSRERVAQALRRTKEFLVATNLDPAVLRGGTPEKAFALLDPAYPDRVSGLRRMLSEPTVEDNPVDLISRFDPDEVRLAGEVVKVRGHLTFKAGKPGIVRVEADYSFVYPVVRAHGGSDVVARTIVRRYVAVSVADPGRWQATEGRLRLETWGDSRGNDACESGDGFLHPSFPDDLLTGGSESTVRPTGPAEDPYDRSRPLAEAEAGADEGTDEGTDGSPGCGTVTRT